MRVLIAGCGYVGMALGQTLARQGHVVTGLRRSHASNELLKAAGIQPVIADLSDPASLARLPADYDWVVHCASASGSDVEAYRRIYVNGSKHLLNWLSSRSSARLVYVSSTGVYGQIDGSVVDENSPTEPAAATAQVLVEAEQLWLAAGRNVAILRVAGIYGPGRGHWFKTFVNGEAQIEGDGGRWLNMVHRDDVAGAIAAALARGEPGRIYNVVDDEPTSQLAFFEWLAAELGRSLPPRIAEVARSSRRGVTNKRVSNQRLKAELGYRLIYPTFREGYREEIENVKRFVTRKT